MSVSAKLKELLAIQIREVLGAAHSEPYLTFVAEARWQALKRHFPRQWEALRTSAGCSGAALRRLADDAVYQGWLRQDLVLLGSRQGFSLPVDVLGPERQDAIRAAVAAGIVRTSGEDAARNRLGELERLPWSVLARMFPRLAESSATATTVAGVGGGVAGAAGLAVATDYEPLTRTPGFEEYAGGKLAEMAASANAGEPSAGLSAEDGGVAESVSDSAAAGLDSAADGAAAFAGWVWKGIKAVGSAVMDGMENI